jgi:hypothetical protein
MRFLGRTGRPDGDPKLDARLRQIFGDKRTPDAPEALYSYLREVSMDSPTDRGRGRLWFLGGLGRMSRTAAALTAALIVLAGAVAVTVVIPRTSGVGAGAAATLPIFPPAPSAPTGWRFEDSFGGMSTFGRVSVGLPLPGPRIAIHVVCSGPDELVVMASTDAGGDVPTDRPLQAAWFHCDGEGRVELVATSGSFQNILAVVARSPSSSADTTYVVSIEVPDDTPTPAPST